MKKKVILLGWDGADWRVIRPLLEQGKMPALQRMMDEGVAGNITTLQPVLSPTLWTSIATGKRPFDHGVYGFTEVTPDGSMVRPVSNLTRKTRALWNILQLKGLKSNVVGWWPSNPAEPIDGVMVSNFYHHSVSKIDEPWPIAPGTIHPPRLIKDLAQLRFHPMELLQEEVLPFVPKAGKIDQEKDRRLASVMKIIAEVTSIHSAATWLWENQEADFHAIYYDALDHFSHLAMKYHPPKTANVSEEDFEIYQHVIEAGYRYHDMMLARWLELAGEDTTIILMSDHGFHPDHLRPQVIPHEPAGPAIEHRDLGIFLMRGPGIRRGEEVHGVNLLDICPTILQLFDLPVGEDMAGKVVSAAFEQAPQINSIESWDAIEGEDGSHSKEKQLDPQAAKESLQQLVDLGYIEPLPENHQEAIEKTVDELEYNKACAYMDAQRFPSALEILEPLWARKKREFRYGIQLATCYRTLNHVDKLETLVEEIRAEREQAAKEALEELNEWQKKLLLRLKEKDPDHQELSDEQFSELTHEQKLSLWKQLAEFLSEEERIQINKLRSFAQIDFYSIEYFSGFVQAAKKNYPQALAHYQRALQARPGQLNIYLSMGEIFLKLGELEEAEKSYQLVLQLDDENAQGHLGLARTQFRKRDFEQATENTFRSIELAYQNPYAHFLLGRLLNRMKERKHAISALETAISLNPNFAQAYRLLIVLHRRFGQEEKATEFQEILREIRQNRRMQHFQLDDKPEQDLSELDEQNKGKFPQLLRDQIPSSPLSEKVITVVSGLPRSGTSMMMQLLEAGGLQILTDAKRQADESNPKGYFELERVKNLRKDHDWLANAEGKTLKVIAQSLPHLPKDQRYRVIFMLRDLDEVMNSQRSMLKRLGKEGGKVDQKRIKQTFVSNLRRIHLWLGQQNNMEVVLVDYRDCLEKPEQAIAALNEFLGGKLSEEEMQQVIDPTLYRERASETS